MAMIDLGHEPLKFTCAQCKQEFKNLKLMLEHVKERHDRVSD
mgnify:CR=1 FL=1